MSGRPGIQPERNGQLQCLECGRWYAGLAQHLVRHDLTAVDYRARHELAATLPLWAGHLRDWASTSAKDRYETLPAIQAAFAAGRASVPPNWDAARPP